MNKKLTALAVAAALAAPIAAQADGPKVYGVANLYLAKFSDSTTELQMGSNTSAVGVKGSMDLDHNLKGIYKLEFQLDPSERYPDPNNPDPAKKPAIIDRDQWLGLSSKEYGTVRIGTMSTSYKSSGKTVDPLYRTPLEGRGFLGIQSKLHSGAGPDRGRSTNTIRYDSPRIAGAKVVANYQLNEGASNTMGLGVHYKNGPVKAHFDYINSDIKSATAMKFGGGYTMGDISVGAQYEILDDGLGYGGDILFLNATYTMGKTAFIVSFGSQAESSSGAKDDHTGIAVAVDHKLGKKVDVYAGWGSVSGGDNYTGATGVKDDSVVAGGLRVKF